MPISAKEQRAFCLNYKYLSDFADVKILEGIAVLTTIPIRS